MCRGRIASETVETLAAIHALDTGPFAEVCERITARELADRLRERAPATGARDLTLTHGDFRPGNLLFEGEGPRVTGALDWETAALGDPHVEAGYLLLDWRGGLDAEWPAPSAVDCPADAAGMDRVRERHREGLAPFTTETGSPGAAELARRHESASGREFVDGGFYRPLAAFGLATVWADIECHAVVTGERDPPEHLPSVAYVGRVALAALNWYSHSVPTRGTHFSLG